MEASVPSIYPIRRANLPTIEHDKTEERERYEGGTNVKRKNSHVASRALRLCSLPFSTWFFLEAGQSVDEQYDRKTT